MTRILQREYTVRHYAAKEQVHISTVRRWVARHVVTFRKTPGGSVRIIERVKVPDPPAPTTREAPNKPGPARTRFPNEGR